MSMQAIVFDFDGTLAELRIDFDAMKRGVRALAAVYMGEEPEITTQPALEWLDLLAEEIAEYEGRDMAQEFHTRGRFFILTQELEAAKLARLFPAARDVLAELRGLGAATGIITRNSLSAVNRVFPDWKENVDLLLAREDVKRVKPDPEHLGEAMRRLGSTPETTILVGDHPIDVETARRAGARCVGVATGHAPAAELLEAGAVHATADLNELMAWLRRECFSGLKTRDGEGRMIENV